MRMCKANFTLGFGISEKCPLKHDALCKGLSFISLTSLNPNALRHNLNGKCSITGTKKLDPPYLDLNLSMRKGFSQFLIYSNEQRTD